MKLYGHCCDRTYITYEENKYIQPGIELEIKRDESTKN